MLEGEGRGGVIRKRGRRGREILREQEADERICNNRPGANKGCGSGPVLGKGRVFTGSEPSPMSQMRGQKSLVQRQHQAANTRFRVPSNINLEEGDGQAARREGKKVRQGG